jgi:hypothetical protein
MSSTFLFLETSAVHGYPPAFPNRKGSYVCLIVLLVSTYPLSSILCHFFHLQYIRCIIPYPTCVLSPVVQNAFLLYVSLSRFLVTVPNYLVLFSCWCCQTYAKLLSSQIPTVKHEISRYSYNYSERLSMHPNEPILNLQEPPETRRLRNNLLIDPVYQIRYVNVVIVNIVFKV